LTELDKKLYPPAETDLIRLLLHHPQTAETLREAQVITLFQQPELARIMTMFLEQHEREGKLDPALILTEISDPALADWISRVIFEKDPFRKEPVTALKEILMKLKLGDLEARLRDLQRAINQAQDAGDKGRIMTLMQQKQALVEQLQRGS
jgi:hypothetical protein